MFRVPVSVSKFKEWSVFFPALLLSVGTIVSSESLHPCKLPSCQDIQLVTLWHTENWANFPAVWDKHEHNIFLRRPWNNFIQARNNIRIYISKKLICHDGSLCGHVEDVWDVGDPVNADAVPPLAVTGQVAPGPGGPHYRVRYPRTSLSHDVSGLRAPVDLVNHRESLEEVLLRVSAVQTPVQKDFTDWMIEQEPDPISVKNTAPLALIKCQSEWR